MRPSIAAALLAWLAAAAPLAAEEAVGSLDELFNEPAADRIGQAAPTDHRAAYEAGEGLVWFGSFGARAGAAASWAAWPGGAAWSPVPSAQAGLTASAGLGLAVRPARELSLRASLTWEYDLRKDTGPRGALALGELYADYVYRDALYARLGVFSQSWGQARFFPAADLVAGTAGRFALRMGLPAWGGLQAVAILPDRADPNLPIYRELDYALRAELTLQGLYLSPAARYRPDGAAELALSLKGALLGTELLAEAYWRLRDGHDGARFLAGFSRVWPGALALGEFSLSLGPDGAPLARALGLNLAWNNVLADVVDVAIEYRHFFDDASGTITPGLRAPVAPFLTLALAMPLAYGADGSRGVVASAAASGQERRIALIIGLELAAAF